MKNTLDMQVIGFAYQPMSMVSFHAALRLSQGPCEGLAIKCLACWSGLHTLVALRAGAKHVTAVERWLYLSLATKQSLVANGEETLLHAIKYCWFTTRFTTKPLCIISTADLYIWQQLADQAFCVVALMYANIFITMVVEG